MKGAIKTIAAVVVFVVVTLWQVQAGFNRTGSIDGGVLLLPLIFAAAYLVRGIARDIEAERRRTRCELKRQRGWY